MARPLQERLGPMLLLSVLESIKTRICISVPALDPADLDCFFDGGWDAAAGIICLTFAFELPLFPCVSLQPIGGTTFVESFPVTGVLVAAMIVGVELVEGPAGLARTTGGAGAAAAGATATTGAVSASVASCLLCLTAASFWSFSAAFCALSFRTIPAAVSNISDTFRGGLTYCRC